MLETRIYHSGVKGMRWGHRKKDLVSPEKLKYKDLTQLTNSGRDFVMSKSSQLYRATNAETEKRGRLYVSAIWSDAASYASDIDAISGTYAKNIYIKTYGLSKNLKVAGTNIQVKELLDMQGRHDEANAITKDTTDKELYDTLHTKDQTKQLNLDILNADTPERRKYIQRLKKKGYEMAYDLVDGAHMSYRDLPLIYLDSGKHLVETKSQQVWDPDVGWINGF